jgi:hypothetical protein
LPFATIGWACCHESNPLPFIVRFVDKDFKAILDATIVGVDGMIFAIVVDNA